MTHRKHIREIVTFARSLGIRDAKAERRRKHVHLVGTLPGGRTLFACIPHEPCPYRGMKNIEADIKRAVRT